MKQIKFEAGATISTIIIALAFFGGIELAIKIVHLLQVHP